MSDHGDEVAILPGALRRDSSQPQQQEITVDQPPQMSIDELLKVIKGANGMPVLFVPSSDGRLAAVAVDGLQNLMTTNSKDNGSTDKNEQDFRAWLLLLTSLVATVTFSAGLNPPGGFWAADDKANGHIAGTSVMHDTSPRRYFNFYISNTTALFSSWLVIIMLASSKSNPRIMQYKKILFLFLVWLCYLSLGFSYVMGTRTSKGTTVYAFCLFGAVYLYMSFCLLKGAKYTSGT